MALIKFKDIASAIEFVESYRGKEFRTLQVSAVTLDYHTPLILCQPELCQVVQVTAVKIEAHDEYSLMNARLSSPHEQPYELPTCPVCLERMDTSITGLVTVPCSHTFHCMCLTKWGDSRWVWICCLLVWSNTYSQMSSLQILAESSVSKSQTFKRCGNNLIQCCTELFDAHLLGLLCSFESLDLPDMRKYWLRTLRPCTRIHALSIYNSLICP
jgi:hypothetical protein